MSKEYEKARQECAKKYNDRIKELEREVQALKIINKAQADDLKSQSKLQRDFTKLCIFLKMSEKERERVLNNTVLEESFNVILNRNMKLISPMYAGLLGDIANDLLKTGTLDEAKNLLLDTKKYEALSELYSKEA